MLQIISIALHYSQEGWEAPGIGAYDGASEQKFDAHRNPSNERIVGRHIRSVVEVLFADVDESATRTLRERTLADYVVLLREDVERTGDVDAREGESR